jgi:hypothetical protein
MDLDIGVLKNGKAPARASDGFAALGCTEVNQMNGS